MRKELIIACLEAAVLAGRMNNETPAFRIASAIYNLNRIGSSLHHRYEAMCDQPGTDTPEFELRTTNLQHMADDTANYGGLTVTHQTDPRGWPIILHFGATNVRIGGGHD